MNYCTNFFPDQADFYNKDAIATAGWTQSAYPDFPCTPTAPCAVTYTPNVLIGDVFYVDSTLSGRQHLGRPGCRPSSSTRASSSRVRPCSPRRGRSSASSLPEQRSCECRRRGYDGLRAGVALNFQFPGDGREPLGDRYGFRYLADQAARPPVLAHCLAQRQVRPCMALPHQPLRVGRSHREDGQRGQVGLPVSMTTLHQVKILTYDNDENLFGGVGVPPGPSGPPPGQQVAELHLPRVAAHRPAGGCDRELGLGPGPLQGRLGRHDAPTGSAMTA